MECCSADGNLRYICEAQYSLFGRVTQQEFCIGAAAAWAYRNRRKRKHGLQE